MKCCFIKIAIYRKLRMIWPYFNRTKTKLPYIYIYIYIYISSLYLILCIGHRIMISKRQTLGAGEQSARVTEKE